MILTHLQKLGINITRINDLTFDTGHDDAFRTIHVKCCCNDEQRARGIESALKDKGAKHVTFVKQENSNYIFTYSVWDEMGALCDSLMPFKVLIMLCILLHDSV